MKFLIALWIFIGSNYEALSQNLGLKALTEFSNNRKINNAIGYGGYLIINDYSKKSEIMFMAEYCTNKKEFEQEQFRTDYKRFGGSMSLLFARPSSGSKFIAKAGPTISYNKIRAHDRGMPSNWIETYKIKSIGVGCIASIQLPKIFQIPLTFDFFLAPYYLINIYYKKSGGGFGGGSRFSENLFILQVQAGFSYSME